MTISREVLSRCLPFALYMAIMALSPWLAEQIGLEKAQQNWLYALRVAAPLAAIIYFWRDYAELRAQAFPLQGLLATLAASASYIAAPTAMRIAVPEANAALSITAALGITFPFNIVIGIPLYIALAQRLTA